MVGETQHVENGHSGEIRFFMAEKVGERPIDLNEPAGGIDHDDSGAAGLEHPTEPRLARLKRDTSGAELGYVLENSDCTRRASIGIRFDATSDPHMTNFPVRTNDAEIFARRRIGTR